MLTDRSTNISFMDWPGLLFRKMWLDAPGEPGKIVAGIIHQTLGSLREIIFKP